ncbi:PAB1 binding protein [Linderina macrospora]|uniref:PAB1 binding protein n=1 Tax=Linderina macrospora TaxID=4868 RepID=A0ACC1J285_9FUNG|nr:PAB1 binding protein [Linderina macrospora]
MQPMYNPGPGQGSGGGYQNQRPFNSRSGGGVGGGGGGSGGRPHMSGPMHSGGPDGRYQPGPANAGNTIQQLYIPADKVGILIGRKGETINGIRRATNAEVEIQNADPGSRNRLIIITGREPCVRSAYTMIKDKVANSHPGGQW